MRWMVAALILAPVAAGGCNSPIPADVRKTDPSRKIPTIQQAVSDNDRAHAAELVRDLRSDDAAIRFYAIEGLRRLTDQTLGYRYFDPEPARHEATKRWENWLIQQTPATAPLENQSK